MLQNPNVTVRFRGVMEKCTFCVQRIRRTQQYAHIEDRDVQDGEVRTACQQACPAERHRLRRPQRPEERRRPEQARAAARYECSPSWT